MPRPNITINNEATAEMWEYLSQNIQDNTPFEIRLPEYQVLTESTSAGSVALRLRLRSCLSCMFDNTPEVAVDFVDGSENFVNISIKVNTPYFPVLRNINFTAFIHNSGELNLIVKNIESFVYWLKFNGGNNRIKQCNYSKRG